MPSDHTTRNSPIKLCECGCGQPAPIAKRTISRYGWIKGQPKRFISGHNNHWPSDETRFRKKVDKREPDECWPWLAGTNSGGYGNVRYGGKTLKAHRVAYELHYGPIPEGMDVCHTCDNPSCCNPRHLFVGTVSDNMRDMVSKGRNHDVAGERNSSAKLRESDISTIRHLATQGLANGEIARRYGVSEAAIWLVIKRRTWKHVA